MAKILHGKSLSKLDTNKEYLVYYSGKYSGPSGEQTCEGFGKIKYSGGWHTYLYVRGNNYAVTITVTVTSINSSFIVEL